jgi:nitrite reductase/ring-hydroxylating ferredoxin subunit/uncharacterized membrane protein
MRNDGVNGLISKQEWLAPVEEGLQKATQKTFEVPGGQEIKNFLHGTWLGHPLHVVLTDIPIGAWTAAVIMDALDSMNSRREYKRGADAAVGIGIVGALCAAAAGLADWQAVDPPARRVGLLHGLLNVASVTLFGGSYFARKNGNREKGRGLATLGFAISMAAAWLGGDLVYGQRIGVDHTDWSKLPEQFTSVIQESEVPEGKPVRADHQGTPILLVRRGTNVFAIAETCSHLGGPLSEGKLDGDIIQCPWHGSRFSVRDGHVVDGPAVHPAPCLETRVRNGQIEVRRSDCRTVMGKNFGSDKHGNKSNAA